MTKFVSEFKKFINRGNVVDLAVGIMVGAAFTQMVNGLSNYIFKPVINFIVAKIMGVGSMSDMHTFLSKVYDEAGEIDLSRSIYIDWSSFISAVINFAVIALVLFCLVKLINKIREEHRELAEKITLDQKEKKELRLAGIKLKDKVAVAAWRERKKQKEMEAAEAAKLAAEEKARREKEENPTSEDLLKLILQEMRKK